MIIDVKEVPITWRACKVDYNPTELSELLEGSDWDVLGLKDERIVLVEPQPSYEKYGYVENRTQRMVWHGDWIVVSSVGEVRKLTSEQYTKEFEEV
jgi:hypothetical protein